MLWIYPYISMIIGLYIFKSAWLAFILYHLFILFSIREEKSFKILIKGWDNKIGFGAIIFGLLGGIVLYLLAPYAEINSEVLQPALKDLGLYGIWWLLFVIYHFLVNPWFEEIFWRKKLGNNSTKLVTNDFLFAGYHVLVLALLLEWLWILVAFIILVIAAWLWRQLATRYKGLLLPVLSHMAADASIMLIVYSLL
jgi:membrane protease YdiL (CAAX protease family)